jgi:hypothetical protein
MRAHKYRKEDHVVHLIQNMVLGSIKCGSVSLSTIILSDIEFQINFLITKFFYLAVPLFNVEYKLDVLITAFNFLPRADGMSSVQMATKPLNAQPRISVTRFVTLLEIYFETECPYTNQIVPR